MSSKYLRFLVLFVVLAALVAATPRSAPAQGSGPVELTMREIDSGASVSLQADQLLVLDLEQNSSTGFMWEVTGIDDANLKQLESTFVPAPPRADGKPWVGAPGRQVLRFAALKAGSSSLALSYRRPWEKDVSPARTFNVQVTAAAPITGAALAFIPPAPQAAPLASMVDTPELNATTALSSTFNWCSTTDNPLGRSVCTAVANQGSCGSCWAFGTEGVVEAAIKKADGADRDTSEQYLVSCNTSGYSCNGGWWAFGLAINQVPAGETNPGVRWEGDFPYQAANAPCNPPYAAHEVFVSSGSVASSGNITTDVAAIKQAIADYGPIAAAVCVGPQFSAYKSGIFATDEVTKCNGSVNHAIVLYGWDDTAGVWYLRNSWGPGWGESGNMRIKWGTSKVGYGATYAVYNGPTANYNIAGYVRTPGGLGVADATVSFNNARSVKTNTAGYFIQTGFSNGSYTVKATATNYAISPTQQTAVVSGASVANVNFTGTQPAQYHRISGYVRQTSGAGIPGATVSFTGTATRPNVKTDTYGFFSQDSVLTGTYTVTVAAAGYTVTPTYRIATVNGADVLVDPFTGSRPTYTLTGYIKTAAGVGIQGVTVGFANEFPPVTTDVNGYWSRDGIYSGHPSVIPAQAGWVFSPTWKILTVSGNQSNINFTGLLATYNLTGTVKTSNGVSINGVKISFGGVVSDVNTSSDGYLRTGFISGTVVVVSPTLSGYAFVPPSQQITFGPADAGASFIGTPLPVLHNISGAIKDAGSNPIPNVSVSFGAARPPVNTDSSGVFTQTGFPDGLYTLEPALSGYSFNPPTQTFTLSGSDKNDVNFTATQLTYNISGRVTVAGAGVPATLAFGDALNTTADASGYYTMTGLPNGEYSVGPGYTGSRFTPPARTVVINGADATHVDFDGALQTYCVSGYARWYNINTPIVSATVSFSGAIPTVMTDEQGLYQSCDVPYGSQQIRFQADNVMFYPAVQDVAVIRDLSNADSSGYTDYFTVTGQVVDAVGTPMPNVTINVLEWGYDDITDGSGEFTDIYNYTDVTFVPKRDGYTFTPDRITVKADGTDKTGLIFTATQISTHALTAAPTFALTGHVYDEGGHGVPGAMIYYEDGPNNIYLGTSGLGGLYVIQGIVSGTVFSYVGAYHPAYDFPYGWTITVTGDETGRDFTGTKLTDFLVGQAVLQGHYDAPNDQWWFGYPLTVELFTPGAATPDATYEAKLDSWGYFVVPGVTPGNYDIRIKNQHSLSQKRLNIAVAPNELVRFPMLHEGDVTNDDGIWYEDFDAMQNVYATCVGDANYNPLADIDDSGCVWGYDLSLLTTNFGIGGHTAASTVSHRTTPTLDSVTLRARASVYNDASRRLEDAPLSAHGRFLLTPSTISSLTVGEIFTVAVGVRSPVRGLDSVTAFLQFDPNYLEVVDAEGEPADRVAPAATLPLAVINQVDNARGNIDLVVNRTLGSVPVTGTFDLATLRFRLKQKTTGTAITFDNTDSRLALSDIDLEGYGYLKRDGLNPLPTVTVSSANHAPVAVDDRYATRKNTVLYVPAPGATANDTDADGDPFWLTSFIPPTHGTLVLYTDGSLVYTPTLDFAGTDTFPYWASDGQDESHHATVTIDVNLSNNASLNGQACDLIDAITSANTDTATGDCLAGSGADTITLLDDVTLTSINTDSTSLPIITSTITIAGGGHTIVRDASAPAFRIFEVDSTGNLTLDAVKISGGYVGSARYGGGIFNRGMLMVTNSTLSGNSANYAGGGGIYNEGMLTVTNSTLSDNSAHYGGGICNGDALMVTNSTLFSNSASSYGGGIYNGGALAVTNSTLSGNQATGANLTNDGGGAIDQYGTGTSSTILNSTIVSNTAVITNAARSGIWLEAGTLTLRNSVVANNNGANNFVHDGGTFTSQGYNLSNDWNGLSIQPTDLTGDPRLDALADNGGGTQTYALLPDSPAIDAGDAANCPATDQRGAARNDLGCDIGAYELTYTNSHTVQRAVSSSAPTTFGPALLSIQRDPNADDPGVITVTKSLTWKTTPTNTIAAYWYITPTAPSLGFNLTLTLCYTPTENNGLSLDALRFWRFNAGSWSQVGGTPVTSTVGVNQCAMISGVTELSVWTLGGPNRPTAVTLINLAGGSRSVAPSDVNLAVALVVLMIAVLLGGLMARHRLMARLSR